MFPASAMARLEQIITNIVDIFLEYADDEGKKKQLNMSELKKMLEQEIQSPELKVNKATHPGYMACMDTVKNVAPLLTHLFHTNVIIITLLYECIFQDKINAVDIEEAMEMLDKNHDGEVNFREFCRCVSVLAKCYYQKKTGKGGKRGKGKEKEGEQEV